MIEAIAKELILQKEYLGNDPIETVYFGGGTPSLMSSDEIQLILKTIRDYFEVVNSPEITLEANPDDLNEDKLAMLSSKGVNRLSIGIQSFDDTHLAYLNRAHSSKEAADCVANAKKAGIDNISIDLIYAIPNNNHDIWENDLRRVIELKPTHISSYCLTIENKTVFGNWLKKGEIQPISDEYSAQQFEILLKTLSHNGYEQYEVSNFCIPGQYSVHNSNYWKQKKYLGIGPSAHSYNELNRQHNISNNKKYLKGIDDNEIPCTLDVLDHKDHINEYLLTTLRTKWGANLKTLRDKHNFNLLEIHRDYINDLLQKKLIDQDQDSLVLTNEGKLFADKIASDLFLL